MSPPRRAFKPDTRVKYAEQREHRRRLAETFEKRLHEDEQHRALDDECRERMERET